MLVHVLVLLLSLLGLAAATATSPIVTRPMSIGWFDNRAQFLACEPQGGVGLNLSVLTHVTVNGCGLSANNSLDCVDKLNMTTLQLLAASAHAAGTKVMLTVDFTTKECTLKNHVFGCPVLAPGTVQDAHAQSLVVFVHVHGLDGVEVDFEAFNAGLADDLVARTLYSALLLKIKRALAASVLQQQQHTVHARRRAVGVCLTSYDDRNPFIFDEISTAVIVAVDYYNVMSYEWSATGSLKNGKTAVANIAAAVFPKARINTGVAFYEESGSDYCSLVRGCSTAACVQQCTAPASNTCNGKLFDGQRMQTAMGSVLIFQVNYV